MSDRFIVQYLGFAELAAHANHPVETHYAITLAELDTDRGRTTPTES